MSALSRSIHNGFVGRAFAILGAASAASAAVEGHRRPSDRHLRLLGINPADFDGVGRG